MPDFIVSIRDGGQLAEKLTLNCPDMQGAVQNALATTGNPLVGRTDGDVVIHIRNVAAK